MLEYFLLNHLQQGVHIIEGGYNLWKNWSDSNFGLLSKTQIIYFNAELRRCGFSLSANYPLNIVEVGFGNGSFLKYAQIKGWDITGIEKNDSLVGVGCRAGFNCYATLEAAGLEISSIDLVVAFDVLEHMHECEILEFLLDIKKILKPGGVLIARFPNGDSPLSLPNQNGDATHITYLGSGKICYIAQLASLELVALTGEARPLLTGRFIKTIHRACTEPVIWIMNKLINIIFYPTKRINFLSANTVALFRKAN